MKISSIEFPDFIINCVSNDKNIEIIEEKLQKFSNNKSTMIIDKFVDDMISNKIFSYAYSTAYQSSNIVDCINYKLKQNNLLINEAKYLEAMFILYPDKMSEILSISQEEKYKYLKENFWKDHL